MPGIQQTYHITTMTVAEYNSSLERFINDLEKNNRPLAVAAQSSVQQIGNRIFDNGKKSDGTDIGQYNSTDPLYINPDKAPNTRKLKPTKGKEGKEGKEGKHVFKNGNVHKTTYVSSYKDYKGLIGQKNDKVYLKDTNVLEFDFRKGNTATKINTNTYTIQLDKLVNDKKIEGLNEKYGMITDPTKLEVDTFERNANLEFSNMLEKYNLL